MSQLDSSRDTKDRRLRRGAKTQSRNKVSRQIKRSLQNFRDIPTDYVRFLDFELGA